eukprot:39425-Prymnesium_polylepis.2
MWRRAFPARSPHSCHGAACRSTRCARAAAPSFAATSGASTAKSFTRVRPSRRLAPPARPHARACTASATQPTSALATRLGLVHQGGRCDGVHSLLPRQPADAARRHPLQRRSHECGCPAPDAPAVRERARCDARCAAALETPPTPPSPWARVLSGELDFDGLRAIAVVHALSADFDVQIMQTRIFKQARRPTRLPGAPTQARSGRHATSRRARNAGRHRDGGRILPACSCASG